MQISISNIVKGTVIGSAFTAISRYFTRVTSTGGIYEGAACAEAAINRSSILEKASLIFSPSGYKEDLLYSEFPLDGSGDLSFTRASNGTRINSAGLVEVCPWNLMTYSEDLTNTSQWNPQTSGTGTASVTGNYAVAPNGTTTADRVQVDGGTGYAMIAADEPVVNGQIYTYSVWLKSLSGTPKIATIYDGSIVQTATLTSDWVRYTFTFTGTGGNTYPRFGVWQANWGTSLSADFLAWGAQLNIGSTAKPYFPTTDRLNVPRLTYQNGGGGCPSLLLEKQSTNLITYSEDLSSSDWTKQSGISVTANQTISPDGTQNADLVTGNGSLGILQSGKTVSTTTANTKSVWLKGVSGGEVVILKDPNATLNSLSCTLTTSWQRFTLSEVQSGGLAGLWVSSIPSGGIYMWGAQLENSTYPTSYIPTTSTSATRVADAGTTSLSSSIVNASEGVLFLDYQPSNIVDSYPVDFQLQYNGSNTTNGVTIYHSGATPAVAVRSGGSIIFSAFLTATTAGTRNKIALAYKGSDFAVYQNGVQKATQSSGIAPAALNELRLSDGTRNFSINQALVFPTRLTNAELASLTTI